MSGPAAAWAGALRAVMTDRALLERSAAFLQEETSLWETLVSPVVRPAEKCAVLARLPLPAAEPALLRFYQLLADKGRMALLPRIVTAYAALEREERGEGLCLLRCARPPEQEVLDTLANTLCRLHGRKSILFQTEVDPAVLGGFVLQMDGVTYDNSVQGRLQELARMIGER